MKKFNLDEFNDRLQSRQYIKKLEDNLEFAINKKEGRITAFIKNTAFNPIELLISHKIITLDEFNYFYTFNKNFKNVINHCVIENSYSGRAILHPRDTWNEEIGKKIAKARCLYKYNKAINRALNYYWSNYSLKTQLRTVTLINRYKENRNKFFEEITSIK